MRNILITGGAGFIGSSLADALLQDKNNFVVLVDDLSTGLDSNLPAPAGNSRFIKCDVNNYSDISAIMLAFPFEYVFHYAAVVGVERTLTHPVNVLRDIDGLRNILDLSKNTGVSRVFFSSSSEVYGEPVELPQNEKTTPLNSRLPYAVVKNVGEAFLRAYQQEFDLDFTIFRFFNTYGPKQSEDFVISKFIQQAGRGEDVTIYGDGSQTRTFCYIDDNVEATIKACMEGQFVNDVINVGDDIETPIADLAKMVIDIMGSSSKIANLPPLPEGDMDRRQPDISKMKKLIARTLTPLEGGLQKTINAHT